MATKRGCSFPPRGLPQITRNVTDDLPPAIESASQLTICAQATNSRSQNYALTMPAELPGMNETPHLSVFL